MFVEKTTSTKEEILNQLAKMLIANSGNKITTELANGFISTLSAVYDEIMQKYGSEYKEE